MDSQFPDSLLQNIENAGVVSVLILEDADQAVPVARALLAGGVNVMELTLRTEAAVESLRRIRAEVPDMIAGIGTVLRTDQVQEVASAGAHFAVAPGLNPDVIECAQEIGLPFAPGVMTPSEIECAIELGCRELKFFPAMPSGGLPMLDSIRAPFAHLGIRLIPLGGIKSTNMAEWLSHPGVFAVGGSWLTPQSAIQAGDWQEITRRAAEARTIANNTRGS